MKTVDAMEVAKLTSVAQRVIGDSFDINSYKDVTAIKQGIVQKVFPVVDEAQLKSVDSLEALYDLAVKQHTAKVGRFDADLANLTTDSKEGGAKPIAAMMSQLGVTSTSTPVVDSKEQNADPYNPEVARLKFVNRNNGGE